MSRGRLEELDRPVGNGTVSVGVSGLPLTADLLGGAFSALPLAVALWWTYFVRDEQGAESVFSATPPERRWRLAAGGWRLAAGGWRLAMNACYYAFLPMLLGIAHLAAGVKKSLGHLTEQQHAGPAVAVASGVALFLAGDVAFLAALRLFPVAYRAAAVPVALATAMLGVHLSAVVELLALVAVLVAMLAAGARWAPCETRESPDSPATVA
nr:low temperature requirement protein A [Streptomyces sp. NBC_00830]